MIGTPVCVIVLQATDTQAIGNLQALKLRQTL